MAIEQYTTTSGSNTNVIASVRDFTDDQKAAFNELLARNPGMLSLSNGEIISTRLEAIELYGNFCSQHGIDDPRFGISMTPDDPDRSVIPNDPFEQYEAIDTLTSSLKSPIQESEGDDTFGVVSFDTSEVPTLGTSETPTTDGTVGPTEPPTRGTSNGSSISSRKMTMSELMVFMESTIIKTEFGRKEALSKARSVSLNVSADMAQKMHAQKIEAAEKTHSAAQWQAAASIAAGALSFASTMASTAISAKMTPKQNKIADNDKVKEKYKIEQEQTKRSEKIGNNEKQITELEKKQKIAETKIKSIEDKRTADAAEQERTKLEKENNFKKAEELDSQASDAESMAKFYRSQAQERNPYTGKHLPNREENLSRARSYEQIAESKREQASDLRGEDLGLKDLFSEDTKPTPTPITTADGRPIANPEKMTAGVIPNDVLDAAAGPIDETGKKSAADLQAEKEVFAEETELQQLQDEKQKTEEQIGKLKNDNVNLEKEKKAGNDRLKELRKGFGMDSKDETPTTLEEYKAAKAENKKLENEIAADKQLQQTVHSIVNDLVGTIIKEGLGLKGKELEFQAAVIKAHVELNEALERHNQAVGQQAVSESMRSSDQAVMKYINMVETINKQYLDAINSITRNI